MNGAANAAECRITIFSMTAENHAGLFFRSADHSHGTGAFEYMSADEIGQLTPMLLAYDKRIWIEGAAVHKFTSGTRSSR